MKKKNVLTTLSVLAFLCMCITVSCKKDAGEGSSPSTATVTEQDAADAVSAAVTPQSAGMSAQVSDATVMAASNAYSCGAAYDSSIARASATGSAITYAFKLDWNWKLSCASPANFTAGFTGHTTYDAPRMSSNDSSNGSFVITGLSPENDAYTLNTSYVRHGSQQSKINNKNSFTSTITITAANIVVSKASAEITAGTAAVTISGASSSGKSFQYSGTITFTGSKTATLQMAGGSSYQLTW